MCYVVRLRSCDPHAESKSAADAPKSFPVNGLQASTGLTDRLDAQINFLKEADQLKSVLRASLLIDDSRHENSAEHSWHIMLFAFVLADQAGPDVQINRVLKMLLLHDIVEIDAGDAPIHGNVDHAAVAEDGARVGLGVEVRRQHRDLVG